jgi:hypothetical protein
MPSVIPAPVSVIPAKAGIQRPQATPRHVQNADAPPSAKRLKKDTPLAPSLRWEDGKDGKTESQTASCHMQNPPHRTVMLRSRSVTPHKRNAPPTKHPRRSAFITQRHHQPPPRPPSCQRRLASSTRKTRPAIAETLLETNTPGSQPPLGRRRRTGRQRDKKTEPKLDHP